MWLKHKYLGTYAVKVGKETIEGQVYATPKGKGKMATFMHSVLVFAEDKLRVRLSLPMNCEYLRVRKNEQAKESKQKAKEERDNIKPDGKGSSRPAKARSPEGEQQWGLL